MKTNYPLFQLMNERGEKIQEGTYGQMEQERAKRFYEQMMRARLFDRQAIHLQRQGRLGTYVPYEGQEAAQIGSMTALDKQDWIFPSYREHGGLIATGAKMESVLLYWGGHPVGSIPDEQRKVFAPAIPIATQIPQAAGVAWASKLQEKEEVTIVYFGDGATSEGDFHEGMNFASVYQVPLVLFNQNNGYAISVPITKQMNSETIAQKAVAYDIPSVRVDGNDVFAVYEVTKRAVEHARSGQGPMLIEAVTWRKGAHTTADDPAKYREPHEGEAFMDPVERLTLYLKEEGWWDEEWAATIEREALEEIERAIDEVERYPKPDASVLFDHVYATLPSSLEKQKRQFIERGGRA